MADAGRARRLAGRIKQIVATQLETQVKDPRLGMVTITDVRVTGDLHDATIFYTVFGDDAARGDSRRGAGVGQGRAAQRGRPPDRRAVHADADVRARRAARQRQAHRRPARRRGRRPTPQVEAVRQGAQPGRRARPVPQAAGRGGRLRASEATPDAAIDRRRRRASEPVVDERRDTRRLLALSASAFVVLAAEPLYLLVDTAVVGHLGSVPLGGLGVGAAP